HLLDVLHRAHTVALLIEETLEQTTQASIVIDNQDFFAFNRKCSAAHRGSLTENPRYPHGDCGFQRRHYGSDTWASGLTIVSRFFPERFPVCARAVFIMRRFSVWPVVCVAGFLFQCE